MPGTKGGDLGHAFSTCIKEAVLTGWLGPLQGAVAASNCQWEQNTTLSRKGSVPRVSLGRAEQSFSPSNGGSAMYHTTGHVLVLNSTFSIPSSLVCQRWEDFQHVIGERGYIILYIGNFVSLQVCILWNNEHYRFPGWQNLWMPWRLILVTYLMPLN